MSSGPEHSGGLVEQVGRHLKADKISFQTVGSSLRDAGIPAAQIRQFFELLGGQGGCALDTGSALRFLQCITKEATSPAPLDDGTKRESLAEASLPLRTNSLSQELNLAAALRPTLPAAWSVIQRMRLETRQEASGIDEMMHALSKGIDRLPSEGESVEGDNHGNVFCLSGTFAVIRGRTTRETMHVEGLCAVRINQEQYILGLSVNRNVAALQRGCFSTSPRILGSPYATAPTSANLFLISETGEFHQWRSIGFIKHHDSEQRSDAQDKLKSLPDQLVEQLRDCSPLDFPEAVLKQLCPAARGAGDALGCVSDLVHGVGELYRFIQEHGYRLDLERMYASWAAVDAPATDLIKATKHFVREALEHLRNDSSLLLDLLRSGATSMNPVIPEWIYEPQDIRARANPFRGASRKS